MCRRRLVVMPLSHRGVAITLMGLCSVLGAAGACSSDSPPVDARDAETGDVSRDGEVPSDAALPDAVVDVGRVDADATDTAATDTTRVDVVSTDATSRDAPVD